MDTTVPAVEARRWETLAPLTGIAAVLLFIAAFIVHDVIGDTPGSDAPAADFSRYYQQEDGSIWGGSILISFAVVFFFWFIGSLRAALHAAEGGVGRLAATAHSGGIATAVLILASIGTQVSAAILVSDREAPLAPDTAVAFWWLGDGMFLAAFYSTAVLLAATAVVALRTGVLPRWFAWISLAAALVLMLPWVGWAAFIFVLPIWIIATSYLLWQSATRPPST
jgi:hypothetical protein